METGDPEVEGHSCATHPSVKTGLACGRCGIYICPRCMVHTSVGARCRKCAPIRKPPIYDVRPRHYAVAGVVALFVGGVAGVTWALLLAALGLLFFVPWILAMGVGYVIGEAISASVNRKRGAGLAIIAAFGVAVAYGVVLSLNMADAARVTFSPVSIFFALLYLSMAIYIAVNRVR